MNKQLKLDVERLLSGGLGASAAKFASEPMPTPLGAKVTASCM
jgi:hypothetical protein